MELKHYLTYKLICPGTFDTLIDLAAQGRSYRFKSRNCVE